MLRNIVRAMMCISLWAVLVGSSCPAPQQPSYEVPAGDPDALPSPSGSQTPGQPSVGDITFSASRTFVLANVTGENTATLTAVLPNGLVASRLGWQIVGEAIGQLSSATGVSTVYTAPDQIIGERDVVIRLTYDGATVGELTIVVRPLAQVFTATVGAPETVVAADVVELTATPSGGKPPYKYAWTVGADHGGFINPDNASGPVLTTLQQTTDAVGTVHWRAPASSTSVVITVRVTDSSEPINQVIQQATVSVVSAAVQFSAATSSAPEAGGAHQVAVSLSFTGGGTIATPITVNMTDAGTGTATSGTDYTAIGTQTLTFPAGSVSGATQNATVTVLDDGLLEGNETVHLSLGSVTGPASLGAQATHTATIADDDVATVAFTAATSAAGEGSGPHAVAVELTFAGGGTTATAITLNVTDAGTGTAASGADYTAIGTQTVTFPAGSASGATQTASVTALSDVLLEGNETVNLTLAVATGPASLGAQTTHAVTITDAQSATVAFTAATSAVAEAGGSQTVVVQLTFAGGGTTTTPITVNVTDAATGTATSGADYTAVGTQTLTFPAGSTSGTTANATITVLDDVLTEGNETVGLALSVASGPATLGAQSTHTVTITDDEVTTVAFSVAASTAPEAGGAHTVAVRLTFAGGGTTLAPITVDVTDALTGSATSGADYTAVGTQTLTFPIGSASGATQNATVTVLNDAFVEGNETVHLSLGNVTGPAILGGQATHTVTITDDETTTVAFAAATSSAAEAGGAHNVAVVLTFAGGGTTTAPITVNVTDAGTGTATSGADYTAIGTQTVTFPIGSATGATQNAAVAVLPDVLVEGNETLNLSLSGVTGPAELGAQTTHAVTITDDDSATVAFQTATSSAAEGGGIHQVAVRLTFAGGGTITTPISVNVTDAGTGTATSGVDYAAIGTQTLTFPAGSASGTVVIGTLDVTDDVLVENNETVNLSLSGVTGPATLGGQTTHAVTIADNEAATVAFAAATSALGEAGGAQTVTVQLTFAGGGTTAVAITVNVTDAGGGTATGGGTDYAAIGTQTLTFPIGSSSGATQTATVTVVNDVLVEGNETINLALSGLTGPATLGGQTTHTATITDNESATVAFSAATSSASEAGGAHTVAVALTFAGGGTTTVAITVNVTNAFTGSATSGSDYTAVGTQTLTFPIGSATGATQNATVTVLDDLLIEGDETVNLSLGSVTGPAALGGQTTHAFTITDNESATVAFAAATSSASEAAGAHTIAVALTFAGGGATAGPISVTVSDAGTGTATSGSDYSAFAPQVVTFLPGSVSGATQNVTVTALDDILVEVGQTVNLILSGPTSPATLGVQTTHAFTITDDEAATVAFSLAVSSGAEGTSPTVAVRLTFAGGGTTEAAITVDVTDAGGGSATDGVDYTTIGTVTLTFPAGSVTGAAPLAEFSLTLTNDGAGNDGGETINLQLGNVTGPATLGAQATHVFTITD